MRVERALERPCRRSSRAPCVVRSWFPPCERRRSNSKGSALPLLPPAAHDDPRYEESVPGPKAASFVGVDGTYGNVHHGETACGEHAQKVVRVPVAREKIRER